MQIQEKEKLKEEIGKVFVDFLKMEQGNRISPFNVQGLSDVINSVIDNIDKKEEPKEKT